MRLQPSTLAKPLAARSQRQTANNCLAASRLRWGGADAEFSYDAQTGAFSVPNASGDIVIVAAAVDGTPVDKSELEAVIAEAEALNEADYTSGTWRTLEEELESRESYRGG